MTKLKPYLLILITLFVFACDSEDEPAKEEEIDTATGTNEVIFDDDNMVCTTYSDNNAIGENGILSVVMYPCQNSGSKLDGYFKYNERPEAGTYEIVGEVGVLDIFGIEDNQLMMVFYGHHSETLYTTGGTATLTVNADDATKLDLSWTDVTMEATDGTVVTFSGNLVGL